MKYIVETSKFKVNRQHIKHYVYYHILMCTHT